MNEEKMADYKKQFRTLSIVLLTMLLFPLAGCAAPVPPATSTPDTVLLTQSAEQTAAVAQTQEALAHPSATLTATNTPLPTKTSTRTRIPTRTLTPTATVTITPEMPLAKFLSAGVFAPERNRREFVPNELFSVAINFKNIGNIEWTPGYALSLSYAKGEFTGTRYLELGRFVKPGESCEFDIAGFGSEELGPHVWVYQLYSDRGMPVKGGVAVFYYTSK